MNMNNRQEVARTLKYFMFAASAGAIEMLMFTLLDQFTKWRYWPCYLIALIMSVIWNFTLNRKFTFHSSNNVATAMIKVFAYYIVFTPVSTILGNFLAENMMWNSYIVTLLCLLVNGVTEYLYQRFYVFGNSLETNVTVQKGTVIEDVDLIS